MRLERVALCAFIQVVVSRAFDVSAGDLVAATRCRADVAFARQVAMYLAHVGCGLSLTEVGRLFGRDRTTAAHACRIIEERRDDPGLDISLHVLDSAVRRWRMAGALSRPS